MYSGMLYHFAVHSYWPSDHIRREFVIAVVGDEALATELEKVVRTKEIHGYQSKVIYYNSISEIDHCHVMFVSNSNHHELELAAEKTKNMKAMIVSEGRAASSEHIIFNFIFDGERIRYQINLKRAQEHKIKIPPSIVHLGIIVG